MEDADEPRPPMSSRGERSRLGRLLRRRRGNVSDPSQPGDGSTPPPSPDHPSGKSSWDGLTVPQLPGVEPLDTQVALITSLFHAARAPEWGTVLNPNRVATLPGVTRALVIDASAADPPSSWLGMEGTRLAVNRLVLRMLSELDGGGVTTVFRWDVSQPSPGLEEIASRCQLVVAAPGAEWSEATVLPHGIDSSVFTAGPEPRPSTTCRLTDGSTPGDGATIDERLAHDPHRLVAAFHAMGRLVIEVPDTPTTRHVAAEAVACGVEVAGYEGPPPITATEELDRLASIYLAPEGQGERP